MRRSQRHPDSPRATRAILAIVNNFNKACRQIVWMSSRRSTLLEGQPRISRVLTDLVRLLQLGMIRQAPAAQPNCQVRKGTLRLWPSARRRSHQAKLSRNACTLTEMVMAVGPPPRSWRLGVARIRFPRRQVCKAADRKSLMLKTRSVPNGMRVLQLKLVGMTVRLRGGLRALSVTLQGARFQRQQALCHLRPPPPSLLRGAWGSWRVLALHLHTGLLPQWHPRPHRPPVRCSLALH